MYIAIDIGGTKTELSAFANSDPQSLTDSRHTPTPPDYHQLIQLITTYVKDMAGTLTPKGIGISIASRLNDNGTIADHTNNLKGFYGRDLTQDLTGRFNLSVTQANDAICAAIAELFQGSGRSASSLLHLVIGTGFGGAFVKRQANSLVKIPLEPSGVIIQPQGLPHTIKQTKGVFESYLGGAQLQAQVNQNLATVPDSHVIWRQVSHYLALAVFNFSNLLSPQAITLSGGVIQHRPFILPQVIAQLHHYPDLDPVPPISISQISPNPSLIGALYLVAHP